MSEDVEFVLSETKEAMGTAIQHLEIELQKIRAGKASPDMLAGIMVEYYGLPTPLNQVANVKTADARSLLITPFERKTIGDIEKAIFQANLGITPQNDGENIRLNLPPLTEERRRDLVKMAKAQGEHAKVAVRNHRKDANETIRSLVKDGLSEDEGKGGEEAVQQMTNSFIGQIDKHIESKETEIMTI
jgi:ribosome recycling factor